jgi:FkbM family methyltransferase
MATNPIKNLVYKVLDIATFGKGVPRRINDMTIRFPAKWSRYYENNYEADNYKFLQQQLKKSDHVIDIGAHLGLFSASSSQLVGSQGKIICFEPTPGTYSVLKETLRLNHCDNVIAVQAAVSDKVGTATFYVSHTAGCNSNSLVKKGTGTQLSGYDVQLLTIDSVVSEHLLQPKLIKIDAEGAEFDVLKGGVATFRQYKPVLILGLHPAFIQTKGDSLAGIWDLLEQQSYQVKLADKMMNKDDFCSRKDLFDVHCFPGN